MTDFDDKIRKTEGIYYYKRFVDDIIILSSTPANSILTHLSKSLEDLPYPMSLNESKTFTFDEKLTPSQTTEFEYLGYKFIRQRPTPKKNTDLTILIAESKLDRIRQKLLKSFHQFNKDKNYDDLRGRVKFLTGNQILMRSHLKIKTGIRSNYRSISDLKQLDSLDKTLRTKTIGIREILRCNGDLNAKAKTNQLLRLSFKSGFENRILNNFTTTQTNRYFKAWNE